MKNEKLRVELGYAHGVEVVYLDKGEFADLMMELFSPDQPAPGAALDEEEQWVRSHLANNN